jgi:hypothetical protein
MRRRARAIPFARMRLDSAIRNLAALPATEWPKHLRFAREILIGELAVDDHTTRAVLFASFSAAHACARAINQRSRDTVDTASRLKVRSMFARAGRCALRSPASVRRVIDSNVRSSVPNTTIDSESMEALIDSLVAAFASFSTEATSLTVLRAITPRPSLPKFDQIGRASLRRCFAEGAALLKEDYSAMRAVDQRRVESALTSLRNRRDAAFNAAEVCEAIANALDAVEGSAAKTAIDDLITDYVAAVAAIWVHHAIRPGRTVNPSNPSYRGKFHRFLDLVLTAVVDPWSRRHDDAQIEQASKLRQAHAQLPEDVRKVVSPAPRRSDVEWLVSDESVKKALARIRKSAFQTP